MKAAALEIDVEGLDRLDAENGDKASAKHAFQSAVISTFTTAHQNTHLSMLLKRRDFADWDAIPWGILGSVALARR